MSNNLRLFGHAGVGGAAGRHNYALFCGILAAGPTLGWVDASVAATAIAPGPEVIGKTNDSSEWLRAAERQIDEWVAEGLGELGAAPTQLAALDAKQALRDLAVAGHRHYRVVPLADGGISIRYESGARSARLEITNDSEFVLVTQVNRESGRRYDSRRNASEAATALGEFISA